MKNKEILLIEALQKYIIFLSEEYNKSVPYLFTHGQGCSEETYIQGKAHRLKIDKLSRSLAKTNKFYKLFEILDKKDK